MHTQAEEIVRTVTLDDGSKHIDVDHLDSEKLAALLSAQDSIDNPRPPNDKVWRAAWASKCNSPFSG